MSIRVRVVRGIFEYISFICIFIGFVFSSFSLSFRFLLILLFVPRFIASHELLDDVNGNSDRKCVKNFTESKKRLPYVPRAGKVFQ